VSGSDSEYAGGDVCGDVGRSDVWNRGDDRGDKWLCRCWSGGTSINRDSSRRSVGFWNIRTNSSLSVWRAGSEAWEASLVVCLVKGAILRKPPRGGLHK